MKNRRIFLQCGQSLNLDVTVCHRGQSSSSMFLLLFPYGDLLLIQAKAQLQGSCSVCTHTYTVISRMATSTDIPDLFFFSPFKWMHTQIHSQIFLPLVFFSDYIQRSGSADGDGTNIPLLCRCKLQELWQPPRSSREKLKRCGSATQPSLLQSVMNTVPVCYWEKRGSLLPHTHKYAHTFIRWSKYFTLVGCSPHDHSTWFSPLTHTHTHKHNEAHWLFY